MKALILAAGKGSRLKELVSDKPKPMITFQGKPILEHNIMLCKKYGITDVLINTHSFPEAIKGYFGNGTDFGVRIKYSFEEELLGTSGAVNNFLEELTNEPFFVIYGDNFSDFDFSPLMKLYEERKSIATIGFHYREYTAQSGVAEFDGEDRVIKFVEKPKPGESDSHWVNAGIYLLDPKILQYIPQGFSDFAKDIFPLLLSNGIPIYGVKENAVVKAFDTPEMYKENM